MKRSRILGLMLVVAAVAAACTNPTGPKEQTKNNHRKGQTPSAEGTDLDATVFAIGGPE